MVSFRERMQSREEAATFTHNFVKVPPLSRITTERGRYYVNEENEKFFSVTTFLSKDESKKEGLKKWRDRVGNTEADGIAASAADRGESLHTICERYLSNEDNYMRDATASTRMMFNSIKPHLDKNIDSLYGLELPLYSKYLKSAGTADVVCVWSGKNTIVDFKNSIRLKKREQITGYFMQSSAYCVMFEERTGIPMSRFAIVVACQDGSSQIFYGKRDDYINEYKKLVEDNYEKIADSVFNSSDFDG